MINKYTKIGLIVAISLCAVNTAIGQQDPYLTHWRYNKIFYNPAVAGFGEKHCISANAHRQWLGFAEETGLYESNQTGKIPDQAIWTSDKLPGIVAPQTNMVQYGGTVYTLNKFNAKPKHTINLLGAFASDVIGFENNTYIKLGIAGKYELYNGSSFRLGVAYANQSKSIRTNFWRYHDPLDPLIPTDPGAVSAGTVDLGLYYSNPNINNLWIGVSNTHLTKSNFTYSSINVESAHHYYIMAGMRFENFMGNPNMVLSPAALLKTSVRNSPVVPQLDINGILTYANIYEGGINFRAQTKGIDATCILLGYYPPIIKNNGLNSAGKTLRIGYSYDITMNKVQKVSNGTHEVQINYCFPITLPTPPDKKRHRSLYMDPNPENKEKNLKI